jgi:hypothetical protein
MLESGVVTAANRRHFDVETALGDTACRSPAGWSS